MDPARRTQWLCSVVLILTAALLAGLLVRVVWIERHVSASMREQLVHQYSATATINASRGGILTGDGTALALPVRMFNLFADPSYIADPKGIAGDIEKLEMHLGDATPEEQAGMKAKMEDLRGQLGTELSKAEIDESKARLSEMLAPLLKKTAAEVRAQLEDNFYYKREQGPGVWVNTEKPRRFLWLAREVDEDFYKRFLQAKEDVVAQARNEAHAATEIKDKTEREAAGAHARMLYHVMDGVGFMKSFKRIYPQGQLGSTIIGYANNEGGVDAMEHQLDYLLRGIPGKMLVTRDGTPMRHTLLVQDQHYTPPDNGRDVWLTINSVLQGITAEELQKAVQTKGAESGTAVLMDPYTGRILAMANYPTIDPNEYTKSDPNLRRNKAVTDPYEPGSIFKPFVMAWAIEKHIIKPTDVFDGHFGMYHDPTGRLVRDDHGYGALTVREVLVKSSNICMTQIGWKMGIPTLYEAVTRFGFGQRTGVELPGDQRGIVRPLSQWNKGTLTSVSFGYEIAATPLQLVRGFATFANGGYLVTPRIISAVEESPGKAVPWEDLAGPALQPQIISGETAATMRDIMVDVLGPHGTARSARSSVYDLYGKTGTAHIAGKGRGEGTHGYGAKEYDSSFLCGGPVHDTRPEGQRVGPAPQLVVIVTLHKPDTRIDYYGGLVAAPAATAIMERALMYLQIRGDAEPVVSTAKAGH